MKDDPLDLLASAKDLLTIPDARTQGVWPRAAALLGRQALEMALERYWQRYADGVQWTPMRCQLLSVPAFLGDGDLAGRVAHAWWALSRACHHQAYELGPTHEELQGWLSDVWDLANEVERRCATVGR